MAAPAATRSPTTCRPRRNPWTEKALKVTFAAAAAYDVGVDDEYRVPEVLLHVRRLRQQAGGDPIPVVKLGPSSLYALCEAEVNGYDGGDGVLKALYSHAFTETGWVGEKPEPHFKPFAVCPVCGFVF